MFAFVLTTEARLFALHVKSLELTLALQYNKRKAQDNYLQLVVTQCHKILQLDSTSRLL
jgi:hypothetical protein